MKILIPGIPQPKQSARFRAVKGRNGQTFVQSYQTKAVKDMEANIGYEIRSQLPPDWIPYDGPISVRVIFVFPPLKSFSKGKLERLKGGELMYKSTKPDLTDNLMKGLFDAMNGIVFRDDAQVCEVYSRKIYGMRPYTEIEFEIAEP